MSCDAGASLGTGMPVGAGLTNGLGLGLGQAGRRGETEYLVLPLNCLHCSFLFDFFFIQPSKNSPVQGNVFYLLCM